MGNLFDLPIPDEKQPPIEWPTRLYFRRGAPQRLGGISIWHTFEWEDVFRHDFSQFPNGQRLTGLVQQDCPDDKSPALILHQGEDVRAEVRETDTHYCVIINIDDYLDNAKADAARTYFTLRVGGLTGLVDSEINEIARWAGNDPARMDQLARIAGMPNITIEAIAEWAKDDPERLQKLAEIAGTPTTPVAMATVVECMNKDAVAEWVGNDPARAAELIEIVASIESLPLAEIRKLLQLVERSGPDGVASVIEWALQHGSDEVLGALQRLDASSLQDLNSLAGIAKLNAALAIWEAHHDNDDEEFWQQFLHKNAYVLSQVFTSPIVVVKSKAYVGGKGVENMGGNLVDYLCKTVFTSNALLTEIKTPVADLLSSEYRPGVYNVGKDVTGGVLQVANYKDSLLKECRDLLANSNVAIDDAIDPKCLLIVGNTKELTSPAHTKSFELYRNGLKEVQVITFDELFHKVRLLVQLLEGKPFSPTG